MKHSFILEINRQRSLLKRNPSSLKKHSLSFLYSLILFLPLYLMLANSVIFIKWLHLVIISFGVVSFGMFWVKDLIYHRYVFYPKKVSLRALTLYNCIRNGCAIGLLVLLALIIKGVLFS